jgi:hypothetical protein
MSIRYPIAVIGLAVVWTVLATTQDHDATLGLRGAGRSGTLGRSGT